MRLSVGRLLGAACGARGGGRAAVTLPGQGAQRTGMGRRLAERHPAFARNLDVGGALPKRGGRAAAMFPGQGAQRPGMGRCLAERHPAFARTLEEVDEALQLPLGRLVTSSDTTAEELRDTAVAQPAVLAVCVGLWRVLEGEGALGGVVAVMGHSLGEFTALCAAGAIGLADAARVVRARGEAINRAVAAASPPMEPPLMVALVPCGEREAAEACERAARETGLVCGVANVNSSSQVVISGHAEALALAARLAPSRRAIPLREVGAPFHCAALEPARQGLAEALAAVTSWAPPAVRVVTNEAGDVLEAGSPPDNLAEHLERHLVAPVQWLRCVRAARALGADEFLELGPSRVLGPMVAGEVGGGAGVVSVTDADSVDSFLCRENATR